MIPLMILNDFFKLDKNNIPNLILINATEEYTSLVTYCSLHLKKILGKTITTTRYHADRYFNIDNVLKSLDDDLFHEINYVEVIYKTKPTLEQQSKLSTIYKNLYSTSKLVIITDLLNKRELNTKWVQEINKIGVILTLDNSCVVPLVNHILHIGHLSIEKDALALLLQHNDANITQLLQELEILKLYYPIKTKLTTEDIEQHTSNNTKYNVYKLSHAYLSGNLSLSLQVLDNIYNAHEDAILINWIICEDLKKILKLKAKLKYNHNINQALKEIGVWGDAINTIPTATHRINYTRIINIYKELSQLDFIIKGISHGLAKDKIIQILIQLTTK